MSRMDLFYRKLLLTKFFTKGWGKPDNLKRLFQFRKIISDRDLCRHLVPTDYPIVIDKEEEQKECRLISGHFRSPFNIHLPGIMPEEVQTAYFEMLLPKKWNSSLKPVCVHLAGTGDHKFGRRRFLLARPLLKEANIASVLLENPFYGYRKPKSQFRSSLNNVSDLFVMGGALVLESLALFHWLERQGFGPLGITGISMGGHMASAVVTNWHRPLSCVPCLSWTTASSIFTQMASLAASNWHKPISLTPCLSWSTASSVFTQGVMSGAIPWDFLERELKNNNIYGAELAKMIHSPERSGRTKTEAFLLGQQFHSFMDNLETRPTAPSEQISNKPSSADQLVNDSTSNSQFVKEQLINEQLTPDLIDNKTTTGSITGSSSSSTSSKTKSFMSTTGLDGASTTSGFSTMASDSDPPESGHQKQASSSSASSATGASSSRVAGWRSVWAKRQQLLQSFQNMAPHHYVIPEEALDFMRGVMDECTHLGNFSVPLDPSLIIIVSATNDAYVPRDRVMSLKELWPGAEVRHINRGHIGAFLMEHHVFRDAIKDSFDRQIEKYFPEGSSNVTGKES